MRKIVCPYCDQPVQGRYCKGCRRIVWKPKTIEYNYYLNERHSANEEHCQYHGDILTGDMAEAKKAEIRARMQERQREKSAQRKPSAVPNVPKTRPGSKSSYSSGKKKAMAKIRIGLFIYILMVFLFVLFPIIRNIAVSFSDAAYDIKHMMEPVPEPLAPKPIEIPAELEAVLENAAPEEDLEEWERTDEQVIALGEACTGFGHSEIVYEDAEEVLKACMSDAGLEGEYGTYSYNQVMDHFTWFETVHEFSIADADDYVGILEISADTATGQIHGVSMYTHGEENFFRIADMVTIFMNETGLAEGLPDGRTLHEEALICVEEGDGILYGLEVYTMRPEPTEDDPFYTMNLSVPVSDIKVEE